MIKVNIVGSNNSEGRGVGFYAENLSKALEESKQVKLTNKNPDINHYPFFDPFFPTLPLIKSKPTIVTIHDLTPLAMPDRYPIGILSSLSLIHQKLSLKNVKAIITDSQYSKGDIVKFFNIDFEKVHVTPLAVDSIFYKSISQSKLIEVKKKYKLPEKFILNVPGGPNPNKNISALAKATEQLGIPLVVVGKRLLEPISQPVHPELVDLLELKKFKHITLPGFVPTEDLAAFYQLATLYCQPSLYEGFGLPLLESMAAGCLVVSSNATSLPEIYSSDTITFDPKNISEMRNKLDEALSLTSLEKEKKIMHAQKRAQDFSWEKTAQLTVDVYKSIL